MSIHYELQNDPNLICTFFHSSCFSISPEIIDPKALLIEIETVMDRDTFMTAEQAVTFGIIDTVLYKREQDNDELNILENETYKNE